MYGVCSFVELGLDFKIYNLKKMTMQIWSISNTQFGANICIFWLKGRFGWM